MYKITKREQINNYLGCWLSFKKLLKSTGGLAIMVLFLFAANNLQAQTVIPAATETIADFGIDGDAYDDVLSYWPDMLAPYVDPAPGIDDWLDTPPDGNTATGAGVIDITSPAALDSIAKISAGQNAFTELRMSAPIYTEPDGNGVWIDAAYIRDQFVAGNNQDASVFEQAINKNFDDPRSWTFKTGDVPAKTDIIDVFAHLRRAPDVPQPPPTLQDNEYAYIAASTADADGSNHLDFEYFRKKVDYEGGVIVYQDPLDGDDCGHTTYHFDLADGHVLQQGDVLLSVDYKSGGTEAEMTLLVWIDRTELPDNTAMTAFNALPLRPFNFVISNDNFTACTNSFDSDPNDVNFGYAQIELRDDAPVAAVHTQLNNTGPTPAPSWGTINSGGNQVNEYPEDTFVEIAVNATLLGFDTRSTPGCESGLGSVIVKSRSSHSWTSSLKDMGGPFNLGDKPELAVTIEGGTACLDATPVTLTADTTPDDPMNGSYSYAWEKKTGTNPDVWSPVGGNSPTYDAPTNVLGDMVYRVSVTRQGGCTATSNEVTVSITDVTASDEHTDVSCNGGSDGTVTITFGSGTGPYMVNFNGGGFTEETSPKTYTGLSAGTYNWTVKDANDCEESGSETVGEPTAVEASDSHMDVSCNGGSDGSVTVTFSGGTPPY
ncbi:SprB repeat-containing protein, partial [Aestuariivivens insulae]|uniref:SprB repeat-containing protein n=1 Tax=Aestuariivivens insulae TaxID=1621988 RepID=UPI001F570D62